MKPTEAELNQAVAEALRMRDEGTDPNALAKSLLYLNRRFETLDKVRYWADLYIHFGLPEKEHTQLLLALEEDKRVELEENTGEAEDLGLG